MRAEPKEVRLGERLTLTIRITGNGNLKQMRRPDLQKLAAFAKRFQITAAGDRYLPRQSAREFDYQLRPLGTAVTEIPPLPFAYYRPGAVPEQVGYETTYAHSIPLLVRERPGSLAISLDSVRDLSTAPSEIYRVNTGDALLRMARTVWLGIPERRVPDEGDRLLLEQARASFQSGVDTGLDYPQARKQFCQAARAYAELVERGYRSPALYREEGNSWLLAGELAKSIVAYRQGRILDPADAALKTSLAYARGLVVYHEPENLGRPQRESSWAAATSALRPATSFWLTVVLCGLGCTLIACWSITRTIRAFSWALLLVIGASVPGAMLAIQANNYCEEQAHPIVVVGKDGVVVRGGNGFSYPVKFDAPLNEGVEARLLYVRGDWLQIELLTGEAGWVPRETVLVAR
jgi:hypothetical protein